MIADPEQRSRSKHSAQPMLVDDDLAPDAPPCMAKGNCGDAGASSTPAGSPQVV